MKRPSQGKPGERGTPVRRRSLLVAATGLGLVPALSGCESKPPVGGERDPSRSPARAQVAPEVVEPVLDTFVLGSPPWKTFDPFLFCVHHKDDYPRGNALLGPDESLQGRNIGSDFAGKDGWSMYHGDVVPGFPRHPHRGFETVTVTRRGYIDHSDSLGATARYGFGDVQWMTAGAGIVHAEMFPLLSDAGPNPAELFQIWINLPAADKFAAPHFSMFWKDSIPVLSFTDREGLQSSVTVVAGQLGDSVAPKPPPASYASKSDSDVAIWQIRLSAGARFELPAGHEGTDRTLYFFWGNELTLHGPNARAGGGKVVKAGTGIRLRGDVACSLRNGAAPSEVLMLQGKPIAEPIVKHGPFVMNDATQIRQAMADYRRTGFGGWPWGRNDPVHDKEKGRFAVHADGRVEEG